MDESHEIERDQETGKAVLSLFARIKEFTLVTATPMSHYVCKSLGEIVEIPILPRSGYYLYGVYPDNPKADYIVDDPQNPRLQP